MRHRRSPVVAGDAAGRLAVGLLEYLVERYSANAQGDLAPQPRPGTAEHRQCRYWMHYAEGSLMNWLVMKLVFWLDSKP